MPKSNFLLVDLNEAKTKKLAETITSDTSRKILNHLAEKAEDTETKIAELLQIPLSTVHYHLQKLQEAGLVKAEEFHYSPKGREVNHYKLANKYIIIAPGKVSGLKEKLKGILPVAGIVLGISALIEIFTLMSREVFSRTSGVFQTTTEKAMAATPEAEIIAAEKATVIATQTTQTPNIALWFLVGGVVALGLFVILKMWRERKKKS